MLQLQNKTSGKGPLWLVEKKYALGSDDSCDIKIPGHSVSANHAEFHVSGDDVELVNIVGGSALTVNGRAVTDKAILSPGDIVKLGAEEFVLIDPKASKPEPEELNSTETGWALKALNTALADKHFPLVGSQVIGRSQECDVSLGVVHLSRKHAKVSVTDRGLNIQDLNSSNGTYVNGKKIDQALAVAGDEISFDTLNFRVIGPILDEYKASERPSGGDDLTTIRPAFKIPEQVEAPKQSATKSKAKHRPSPQQPSRPAARSATQESPITADAAEGSKSNGMILALLAVIVGAGVAWFFLK